MSLIIINPTEIECHKCHWKWPVKEGGNDLFICHKCNTDNSKFYKFEGLEGEKILDTISYKKGGRTISQTIAPKKDRVYGSEVNKKSSSSNLKEAKKIQFSDKTILTINKKVKEHNEKHPNKKINLASAKAVVRRGMGAYSNTHRPTISNNKPNSRVAWGIARLNAFTYKIINGKSKSGKYTQDDDLINELKMSSHKFNDGGNVPKSSKMFHLPLELVVYVPSTKDVDKTITKQEMKQRVDEVKNYLGTAFGGYSSVKVEGGYVANDGDLVNEDITKVVSFASKDDYEKKKDELVGKMTYWSEKWGQEAIGFEFEGDLYYVPEKLKKGGSISHPTFHKLNEEMKFKKGGGVYEGWGFNDRVKVLLKGTKNNILKTFKELTILFPSEDKEIIEDKTIEIFIDERDLRKVKKIANYNQITMLYEAGGEIDYSTGWNQDYENDPLVKAKRKAKELAIRAAMAAATEGGSEIARAQSKAVEKMQQPAMPTQQPAMQMQPGMPMQPNQDQTQMLMQLAQSGAFGKMENGGLVTSFEKNSIAQLKEWQKEKLEDIDYYSKTLGITDKNYSYIKALTRLNNLVEDCTKIIKSGILKNGEFTYWKTFNVKSYQGNIETEAYFSLEKEIAYSNPKFDIDFAEFNKKYPYSTKDSFSKEFIGRMTIPILGYKLCDYTTIGFSKANSVGGFRNNSFEKGGSIDTVIDYSKGGSHSVSNQELKSLELAFNRFADKERNVILKKGGNIKQQDEKIAKVMHEFKQHKLHSGSKRGPIVTDREQAIAIALSEAGVKRR